MDKQIADIAAIHELIDNYKLAANTGDLELFMSLWADDGIQMGPDTPAAIGKEQIRASMRTTFENFTFDMGDLGDYEVQVHGDWAFSRGDYTTILTPKSGGPKTHIDGKWLDLLQRQDDGSWKIYRDCFNNNAPPKVEG